MATSDLTGLVRRRLEVLAGEYGDEAELAKVLPQLEKVIQGLARLDELGLAGEEPAISYRLEKE